MINFSNLSVEEFFRLNQDSIPSCIQDKLFEMIEEIKKQDEEIKRLERNNELAWEQVSFARDLVETIDNFAERELPKTKQKMYNTLRENTYFEV